jgi:hypothetical protein
LLVCGGLERRGLLSILRWALECLEHAGMGRLIRLGRAAVLGGPEVAPAGAGGLAACPLLTSCQASLVSIPTEFHPQVPQITTFWHLRRLSAASTPWEKAPRRVLRTAHHTIPAAHSAKLHVSHPALTGQGFTELFTEEGLDWKRFDQASVEDCWKHLLGSGEMAYCGGL